MRSLRELRRQHPFLIRQITIIVLMTKGKGMRDVNLIHHEPGPRRQIVDAETFLPPPARTLIEDLKTEVREGCAMARSLYERLDALAGKVAKITQARSRNAEANRTIPRYQQSDDAVDAGLARQLEEAENETARIERRLADLEQVQRPLGTLLNRLEKYVAGLTSPIPANNAAPPKLGKGETAAQAVARLRREIARLREDRQSVIDAPITSAMAKEIAAQHVRELAMRGAPDVLQILESRSPPGFAMVERQQIALCGINGNAVAGLSPSGFDCLATLAWLFEDVLTARLHDEIDAKSNDSVALTDEARAARLAEIEAAILQCEYDEERLIRLAASENTAIPRRADADLRAVLQLDPAAPLARRGYA